MAISAGLLNFHRMVEDGEVDLASVPEPTPGVAPLEPFFGCRPWEPSREYRTVPLEWCCLLATREVCVVDVCSVCYSDYTGLVLPDSMVCMGTCQRSRLDDRIEAILRKDPPPARGEMGPIEFAEMMAARAKRRREAEKLARKKGKPKAGTDAYLCRPPA